MSPSSGYVAEIRKLVGRRPLILAGATVIITDESGRVLLQRRGDTGNWDIPGGNLELGDTFEDAARREVKEELGLDLEELTFVSTYSGKEFYFPYPNGDEVYTVGVIYTAVCHGDRVLPDGQEALEAHFFEFDNFPETLGPLSRLMLDKFKNTSS